MGLNFIWKIGRINRKYKDFQTIIVSSHRLQKNQEVCSLLENGWEVVKLTTRHNNENIYYQYCLGKPKLVKQN